MPWPDEVAHDAVAVDQGDRLDRRADVGDPAARPRRGDARLREPRGSTSSSLRRLGVDPADRQRPRGVAVVAVDDRAAVDADDVALLQDRLPGMPWTTSSLTDVQSVFGIAPVAHEAPAGAPRRRISRLGDPVELLGRDARSHGLLDDVERLEDDARGLLELRASSSWLRIVIMPGLPRAPTDRRARSVDPLRDLRRPSPDAVDVGEQAARRGRSRPAAPSSRGRPGAARGPSPAGRRRGPRAAAAPEHPLDQRRFGHREVDNRVESRLHFRRAAPSRARACATVRGKPSRRNPRRASGCAEPLADQADHEVVRARARPPP